MDVRKKIKKMNLDGVPKDEYYFTNIRHKPMLLHIIDFLLLMFTVLAINQVPRLEMLLEMLAIWFVLHCLGILAVRKTHPKDKWRYWL